MCSEKGSSAAIDEFHIYLFSAFVSDFFLPIFYIFVPLLAYRLGADPLQIGLVGGTVYATYFFLPVIIGNVSDRLGRRRLFVVVALTILALVSFTYSIASSPLTLIVGRVFEGIAWAMLWPTLMAGISQDGSRDGVRSLGLYNLVWSGAAVLGPPVGSLLVFLTSYSATFALTAVMLTGAVVANLVMSVGWKTTTTKKKKQPESRTPVVATVDYSVSSGQIHQSESSAPSEGDASSSSQTHVAFLLIAVTLSSMTWVTLFTFFPPFSQSVGISILLLGSIGLAATGGRFLTYLLITRKSLRRRILDPEKRSRRILLFLALLSASSLLFLIPDHPIPLYFVSFGIAGVVDAAVSSIVQVGVIAEAVASRAGTAAGLFESSTGIASFVGPIIAGAISSGSLVIPLAFPAFGTLVVLLAYAAIAAIYHRRNR